MPMLVQVQVSFIRMFALATLAMVTVACGPPARPPTRVITVGHLPPGAAMNIDAGSINLKLSYDAAGQPNGFEQGTADATDLVIAFVNTSTVSISNRSQHPLKLDLWLSKSGKQFVYTSSCPISARGSSFENWPAPVSWIYVSNPRILAADAPTRCE